MMKKIQIPMLVEVIVENEHMADAIEGALEGLTLQSAMCINHRGQAVLYSQNIYGPVTSEIQHLYRINIPPIDDIIHWNKGT